MHTVFALLCFVVVIHWLIFPYPSGLLHWHCGNLTIAPVPAKQPWWIWINTSCEFIMNDCITITKQSTTKPCAYSLGYTVQDSWTCHQYLMNSTDVNLVEIYISRCRQDFHFDNKKTNIHYQKFAAVINYNSTAVIDYHAMGTTYKFLFLKIRIVTVRVCMKNIF